MRFTAQALRVCLIAVAAALAAAAANVGIDVAGDYLLAHDTYDGVAHHSRALVLAVVGLVLLLAVVRAIFDSLDRRCRSTSSLVATIRGALGDPVSFAAAAAVVAVVMLVGMESYDSLLTGRLADLRNLLGGSVTLGAGTALAFGALLGWFTHRCIRVIAKYEAPIAAFIVSVLACAGYGVRPQSTRRRVCVSTTVACALVLLRQGRKRGPPHPVFG